MKEKKMPAAEAGKPFVKWAGGKRKLLSEIECGLPQGLDKYQTLCRAIYREEERCSSILGNATIKTGYGCTQ